MEADHGEDGEEVGGKHEVTVTTTTKPGNYKCTQHKLTGVGGVRGPTDLLPGGTS